MAMTNAKLIQKIESGSKYDHVQVRDGEVTSHVVGQPDRLNKRTNTGGRIYLGTVDELKRAYA